MLLSNYKISLKIVWWRVLLIGFLVLQVLGFCDFHASYFAGWVRSVLLFLGVGRISTNLLPGQSQPWGKSVYDSTTKAGSAVLVMQSVLFSLPPNIGWNLPGIRKSQKSLGHTTPQGCPVSPQWDVSPLPGRAGVEETGEQQGKPVGSLEVVCR